MKVSRTDLLKAYDDLPELSQNIVNLFIVTFTGVAKYDVGKFLQTYIYAMRTQKEYDNVLITLQKKELINLKDDNYDVPLWLKLKLFPEIIQNEKCVQWVNDLQKVRSFYYDKPILQYIRDYLFSYYVEENQFTKYAVDNLINKIGEALPMFLELLGHPEYDKALVHSPQLFYELLDYIQLINILYFNSEEAAILFMIRNREFEGLYDQIKILKAEMLLHLGKLTEANELIEYSFTTDSILLKSQIELFKGNFAKSVALYELAQITDKDGTKRSRIEFTIAYEFLYWLNYVFYPEGLNLKKLDTTIRKMEKSRDFDDRFMLPLLYIIKKDKAQAEKALKEINTQTFLSHPSFKSFYYLVLNYIINGELDEKQKALCQLISNELDENKRWLYLRELNLMIEKSNINIKTVGTPIDKLPDTPPCLMSGIIVQEKWEQMLDGLLNLTRGKLESGKKDATSSRVCYLVNLDKEYIQPILQTMNAKGVWSAGRNISLKRLKDQQVDGLTEQDRRMATAITYYSGYYGKAEYNLDFNKAIAELCGHPFLFLNANPSVSIELIKAQPEIITENTKNGIRIKTNITDSEEKIVLVRETQTRYKLITLSPQQQSIIRMINQGIVVPAKGKSKLIETVSNLSGVMMVHSDIAEGSAAVKSIESDSRIRVQIVPIADGLKAELFVKPLGMESPYVKPGKGSKVVYGIVDGEKCQAIRNIPMEKVNSETLTNDVAEVFDADLTEEAVTFFDSYECLSLLEIINKHSDIAILEWPEGERFRLKKSASFANLQLRVKGKGQWFELDGELTVDEDTILSLKELIDLTRKSKGRFIELKSGEYLALTDDLKKHIDELEAYTTINKNGISVNRFASHALEEITSNAASFKTDKSWREFQKKIKDTSTPDAILPVTLDAELRPYQEEGFRWMARLKTWNAGACLADDMGLGKTVQAIAMMLLQAENGPMLVVCPASIVPNWGSELQRFAPTLNVVNLKSGNREDSFSSLTAFDVLVITYGLLQSEDDRISKINWAMAVLDEAHAIKNTQTKSSKAAMNIQSDFKLALTGTPIQNHLGELWNLFNFCNPGLLGTLAQFTDRYVKNEVPAQKSHLKKLITPFILRRTKNKVLEELPPKTEITHLVVLSEKELAFYEALRRDAINIIENNNGPNGQQHLQALAEITKLRLACCNTTLVNKDIHLPSAKLEAFFEIIDELRVNKHRALVFSQFIGHLAIVRKELDRQGLSYQYLDGSTSIPDRQLAVKAFQAGKGELFLISLKAGGLGLNLTAADYVLHLDPWWNPAVEDQASDRAHRIGQLRPVTIYRLVAKNTIEEKIVKLHATKRDLADSLLDGTDQSAHLSTVDLLNLLKEV